MVFIFIIFLIKGVKNLEYMVVIVIWYVLLIVEMICVIYKMGFVIYVILDGLEYCVK